MDEKGKIAVAAVSLFHYADERGSQWGFSTGDWRDDTYMTHHPKFHRWRFMGPLVPSMEKQEKAILVWEWWDAPGELQALSDHGGDEDWVALVPKSVGIPSWAHEGSSFGCCSVSEHEYEDGRLVLIGAHA